MSDLSASSDEPLPGRSALVEFFRARERRGRPRRIGVELELSLVSARDLEPVALEGPRSLERLFAALCSTGWRRRHEGDGAGRHVIGLERPATGDVIALEPGGQVELVTPPLAGAAALAVRLAARLEELVAAASDVGLEVLGGGLQPFAHLGQLPRVRKDRYDIMRRHFAALGPAARLAPAMMERTQSIQASLDWEDEADGALLLEAALRTSAPLAALLAASPVEEGRLTGLESRRLAIWRETDPARTGLVAPSLAPGAGYETYVEWALSVPLLLRVLDGHYGATPAAPGAPRTFRELLDRGSWPDGRPVLRADWETHLTTIFTHARWKKVVECRALDAPLPEDLLAVPALLVGLLEHRPSRDRALERMRWASAADLERALEGAASSGVDASFGLGTLGDEARALVALAREGLEARVAAGLEPPGTPELLAPLERRAATGLTAARELARAFERAGARGILARVRYAPGSLGAVGRRAA